MFSDKDGYYIMINGLIQQEDIIFVNIYASNIEVPKYIKKKISIFRSFHCGTTGLAVSLQCQDTGLIPSPKGTSYATGQPKKKKQKQKGKKNKNKNSQKTNIT